MTQSTSNRVDNIYKLMQGLALALIILFLTRFIQSVDSLTETVNLLKTEFKIGQSQSIDKLMYIEKTINIQDDKIINQGERIYNLEIFYYKRKTESEISKAMAKGRNNYLKSVKK
jgi:hypothetical protein